VGLKRAPNGSLRGSAIVALDRLEEPQLEVDVLSSRGDHLTVQIVRGVLEDPSAILYVEKRRSRAPSGARRPRAGR
jgi:hypothetical protein